MRIAEFSEKYNLGGYKKGTYCTVEYITDVSSVNAEQKRLGTKVQKKTVKTVRLGCDYNNMKATIEAKANGRGTREMYEAPIIKDVLYANKKNDTVYLRIGNVPNNNVKTTYYLNGKEVNKADLKGICVNSFFNDNNREIPEVQNIKLENVTRLEI